MNKSMTQGPGHPQPEIIEAYRDYVPPCNAKRIVETLLRYVPPEYLLGLRSIVLTNSSGLSRDRRREKTWSRNHKVRMAESLGSYTRATRNSAASIQILVDNIVDSFPRFVLCVAPLRNIFFADVLYHEVGHHIHATRRPEYREKEAVAEAWSAKLSRDFIQSRYWYLFPVVLPLGLAINLGKDAVKFVRKLRCRLRGRR